MRLPKQLWSDSIRPLYAYVLLSLIIMLPLMRPGYILTLDMVFTPKLPAPSNLSSTYAWQELLHLINFILNGQIIEKIVIFMILLLCGVGMHRLIETKRSIPKYFAGVFYVINPFTYERWMSGQYLVLAGYALLPFLIKSFLLFFVHPTGRKAMAVILWYSAIATLSLHNFVLGVLLGVIIFAVYFLKYKEGAPGYKRQLIRLSLLLLSGTIILNAYWLVGTLLGHSEITQTVDSFSSVDFKAFTTASNPHLGLFFNVVSMYGFWLERFDRYAMPNHNLFIWIGGYTVIALLSVIGAWSLIKKHTLLAYCLLCSAFIGLIIALGIYAPITGGVLYWIINHIPLMSGFREPEKFSALLVLAYAYFAAHGLDFIIQKTIPAIAKELIGDGAVLLPFLYVTTMPFGFAGQLRPVQYPASWYSFNQELAKKPAAGKVLFLPWHEYMSYDFTPRIIANPAPDFFTNAAILSGTDAQFGGFNDPHPTKISTFIENKILASADKTNLGRSLSKIDVQYILVAHGYDYNMYTWVGRQSDLKLLSSRPGLTVFLNEAYYHG